MSCGRVIRGGVEHFANHYLGYLVLAERGEQRSFRWALLPIASGANA